MSEVKDEVQRATHRRPMPLAEAWIRKHGAAYVGRWVALRDDELVAAADSFSELKRQLPSLEDVLVTVIE